MRNHYTTDLPPIRFNALPEPLVIDLGSSESAWIAFDCAQRELDSPEDKRALALAEKS